MQTEVVGLMFPSQYISPPVPTYLLPNLVPLRIDVFIPDQEQYPQDLRTDLQSSFSVCMRHPRLERLGISGHLCRALDYYCGQNLDFLKDYQNLPFGSKLVFENISADGKAMSLTIVPAHDLERQLLSVTSLQKLWQQQIPPHSWPKIIDLECMGLKRQLHDSISIVGIQDEGACTSNEDLILKSSTNGPKFIYHELKFFLSNPPHKKIMIDLFTWSQKRAILEVSTVSAASSCHSSHWDQSEISSPTELSLVH